MVDNNTSNRSTYVRETEKSSGTMPFIVGGLVVAVGLIAWFMFAQPGGMVSPAASGGDTNTSVTIEAPAAATPAPDVAAPAEPATPAEPAAPAAPANP